MKKIVAFFAMLCVVFIVSAGTYNREDLVGTWKLSVEDTKALDDLKEGYVDLEYQFKEDGTGQVEAEMMFSEDEMTFKMKIMMIYEWRLEKSKIVFKHKDGSADVVDLTVQNDDPEVKAQMEEMFKLLLKKQIETSFKEELVNKEDRIKIKELKDNKLIIKSEGETIVLLRE